jgi:hypothetical protein
VTAANEPGLGDDAIVTQPGGRRPRGRRWLVPAIIASVVQVLLCGIAAAVSYGPGIAPVEDGSTGTPPPPTSVPPSTAAPPSTSSAAVSASATTPPSATSKPTAGPRVDIFKASKAPTCLSTATPGIFTGQIVLQWTVAGGATGSQLFTDGVLFDTFGTSRTVTLAFACTGSPGDTVTHTYVVRTVGGGAQATKSLTASATIP